MKTLIYGCLLFLLNACVQDPFLDRFKGLEPKARFMNFAVYDLVEQKQLICAEAVEFLDEDDNYQYYFNCLKSDQIFFVSDDEVIKIRHFYQAGLIDLNTLYQLRLVDRMRK
jgi:hypothetical protein